MEAGGGGMSSTAPTVCLACCDRGMVCRADIFIFPLSPRLITRQQHAISQYITSHTALNTTITITSPQLTRYFSSSPIIRPYVPHPTTTTAAAPHLHVQTCPSGCSALYRGQPPAAPP